MPGIYDRKDHLYREAKDSGYRSRAAFKLMELDKKYQLLRPGSMVLDLGCYPGGWLQVAAERAGEEGLVVGIDLEPVQDFGKGDRVLPTRPTVICGDITDNSALEEVIKVIGARGVDVVLSDMSPKLSGVRFRDVADSVELAEKALYVACRLLKRGGNFVCKLFPGAEEKQFVKSVANEFERTARSHLQSSRKTSTELYIVGLKRRSG